MDLITISNKYSVDVSEYKKLKLDDIFQSRAALTRKLCYPIIERFTGTEYRLESVISRFVTYESNGGYTIKITAIEPVEKIQEISDALASKDRIRYENRDYLLDYVIFNQNTDELIYLSASEIIKQSNIFPQFYYDYASIYYDKIYSTKEEKEKLDNFIENYDIADKDYFLFVMEMLGGVICEIFSRDNIFNWAKRNGVQATRVLYQNGNELDEADTNFYEENYIQPFIDMGFPSKSVIKLANIEYMKHKNLLPKHHKWFYYKYKFEKPNELLLIDDTELKYHQQQMNGKIIKRLRKETNADKIFKTKDDKRKDNLDYIIKSITK